MVVCLFAGHIAGSPATSLFLDEVRGDGAQGDGAHGHSYIEAPCAIFRIRRAIIDGVGASTVEIARDGEAISIAVHDHIIVGKEGHASFKGLRLI